MLWTFKFVYTNDESLGSVQLKVMKVVGLL